MFVCELTLFILTADKDELLDCYSTASSMEVYPDQQQLCVNLVPTGSAACTQLPKGIQVSIIADLFASFEPSAIVFDYVYNQPKRICMKCDSTLHTSQDECSIIKLKEITLAQTRVESIEFRALVPIGEIIVQKINFRDCLSAQKVVMDPQTDELIVSTSSTLTDVCLKYFQGNIPFAVINLSYYGGSNEIINYNFTPPLGANVFTSNAPFELKFKNLAIKSIDQQLKNISLMLQVVDKPYAAAVAMNYFLPVDAKVVTSKVTQLLTQPIFLSAYLVQYLDRLQVYCISNPDTAASNQLVIDDTNFSNINVELILSSTTDDFVQIWTRQILTINFGKNFQLDYIPETDQEQQNWNLYNTYLSKQLIQVELRTIFMNSQGSTTGVLILPIDSIAQTVFDKVNLLCDDINLVLSFNNNYAAYNSNLKIGMNTTVSISFDDGVSFISQDGVILENSTHTLKFVTNKSFVSDLISKKEFMALIKIQQIGTQIIDSTYFKTIITGSDIMDVVYVMIGLLIFGLLIGIFILFIQPKCAQRKEVKKKAQVVVSSGNLGQNGTDEKFDI